MDMTPQQLLRSFVDEVGVLIDARLKTAEVLIKGEIKAAEERVKAELRTELASKQDIARLEAELRQDIARLEQKLDTTVTDQNTRVKRIEGRVDAIEQKPGLSKN